MAAALPAPRPGLRASPTGSADLPLHRGNVPMWLRQRMERLARVMAEAIVLHYGRDELLRRLSHPFWFQSLGCLMGQDWHASGITTSVVGALKRGLAPLEWELGIHVCGGRGRFSRRTPAELVAVGERTGLDGLGLAEASRLVAKVDTAAVQDGFDLYLHAFVVTDDGKWAVVQQGMNTETRRARRYHWLSEGLKSFVDEPHAGIEGRPGAQIVNLTDRRAAAARAAQVELVGRGPNAVVSQVRHLHTSGALPSLQLAAEVIHGAPCRFSDPARHSLAHGGKDARPFPVPVHVYDETLRVLRSAVDHARLGQDDRLEAIRRLDVEARKLERVASGEPFDDFVGREQAESWRYGGRSVYGKARPPSGPQWRAPSAPRRERQAPSPQGPVQLALRLDR